MRHPSPSPFRTVPQRHWDSDRGAGELAATPLLRGRAAGRDGASGRGDALGAVARRRASGCWTQRRTCPSSETLAPQSPCTYEVNETRPAHWGRPCRSLFIQIQLSLRTGESLQGPHAAGRAARREGSEASLTLPGSLPGPLGWARAGPTARPRPGASPTDHLDAELLALVRALLCTGEELPERLRGSQEGAGRDRERPEPRGGGLPSGTSRLLRGHAEGVPRATGTWPPSRTHLWEAGESD